MHSNAQYPSNQPGKPFHSIFSWFMAPVDLYRKIAKMKKTPHKIDVVPHAPRQLSKWGTAAHMTFHQPPHLPARGDQSGNPLYKGMYAVHVLNVLLVKIQCMECNI